jgi:hypothetical protein
MQTIATIGLDIAKSFFQVHGVEATGQVVIRRQLKRRHVQAFFAKLPPCLIGIEACAASHFWARELQAVGHTVRLIPPAYVKPYVKRQKNDAADAEAICEVVTRAQHAVCADQDGRAAGLPGASSHAPSAGPPTDCHHQLDPGASCRIRDRCAGRAPRCRAPARSHCRRPRVANFAPGSSQSRGEYFLITDESNQSRASHQAGRRLSDRIQGPLRSDLR